MVNTQETLGLGPFVCDDDLFSVLGTQRENLPNPLNSSWSLEWNALMWNAMESPNHLNTTSKIVYHTVHTAATCPQCELLIRSRSKKE